ncbi:MAG: hypothetical protein L6R28_10605 [Planctomycetes bacterium]|nr:hypothetical protein [Planctomycetota bacterium]
MKTLRYGFPLVLILAALASPVFAAEGTLPAFPKEDLLKLVQANLGKDVMVAWVESLDSYAKLDANTLIELKNAKVPDEVLAAAVRHGGAKTAEYVVQPASNEVRELGRYDVPGLSSNSASKHIDDTDYERAKKAYDEDEAVRYTYRPVTTVYDSSYVVPSTYVYADYGWPSYYSSWNYWPYYSNYGYYNYCRPRYSSHHYSHHYYPRTRYYSYGGYYGRSCGRTVRFHRR